MNNNKGRINQTKSGTTGTVDVSQVHAHKKFVQQLRLIPSHSIKELAEKLAKDGLVDLYITKCYFSLEFFGDGAALDIGLLPGQQPSVLTTHKRKTGFLSMQYQSTKILFLIDADQLLYPIRMSTVEPDTAWLRIESVLSNELPEDLNPTAQADLVALCNKTVADIKKQPWYNTDFLIRRALFM